MKKLVLFTIAVVMVSLFSCGKESEDDAVITRGIGNNSTEHDGIYIDVDTTWAGAKVIDF